MAVQPQTPFKEYTANGTTTVFPLDFDCENKDHLIVMIDDVETDNSTWSLNNKQVTFNAAPSAGKKITLQRNTPYRRDRNYQAYDNSFRPDPVNKDFDWIWWKLQELGVADMLLKIYVDRLHGEQKDYIDNKDQLVRNIIDDLRNYVNQQDNSRNSYFENLISRQGVSLQQLDSYYKHLLQGIANIAADKGWIASLVTDASGKNQQELNDLQALKNSDMISIFDFDRSIKADKLNDSSAKINAIITEIEKTNVIPYLYFPTHAHNYRLDSTLVFRKPVPMLFGFMPPNYGRDAYIDMNGWFYVNCPVAFDMGASESTHTGGSWTIKNIGIRPLNVSDNWTQDGIHVTSARNAPERGYNFIEVTATKLDRAIYVKNSANFMAATMVIERSSLSQCNYGFYADQKVDGFKFTGNQCENNLIGGIKLRGAGGINISDNMLEGQPNAIEIDGWSVNAGSQVEIKRNYFEGNYGDFLISYRDTSYGKGTLTIENNEITDLGVSAKQPEGVVTDFCRLHNNEYNYGYTVLNSEPYPITMMDDVTILPKSQLCGKQLQYFIQKDFNGNLGSKVYSDSIVMALKDTTYTQMNTRGSSSETLIDTLFGTARSPLTSDYLSANVNAATGDVITANILFRAEFSELLSSGLAFVVYTTGVSIILQMNSANLTQDVNGKYILGTFTFKMPSAQPTVLLKVRNSSEPDAVQMIAGCFKNHRQFSAPLKIKQVMPSVSSTLSTVHLINGETINAGASKTYSIPLSGARLGDFIEYSFTDRLVGLDKSIEITTNNTLVLTLKNPTAAAITTANFRTFIKVSKG